jgi:thymidylate kinase
MIITVDGYDGTGKTTLAKNIAKGYGFLYVDKPIIRMYQSIYKCDYDTAAALLKANEKKLYSIEDKVERARACVKFYTEPMLWLRDVVENNPNHLLEIMGEPLLAPGEKLNVVMDRGILTTYAVVGDENTKDLFDYYIAKGAAMDGSIYLTADDYERVRRIYERDPSDPDLKRDPIWRKNDLLEYAEEKGISPSIIPTDGKTTDQVFAAAQRILDPMVGGDPVGDGDGMSM